MLAGKTQRSKKSLTKGSHSFKNSEIMTNLDEYMIVPPHLNAEAYRNDTSGNTLVSYLDYIKIHSGTYLTNNYLLHNPRTYKK